MPSSVEAAQELQREQEHVDRAYARLDVMKRRAQRRYADASVIGSFGSTPQALLARDIFADVSARRVAELEFGELPLVFGRTDDVQGDTFHIGRIGVLDEDSEPLVVDWRAPAAEPFYRATPAQPHGLVRRRHLRTSGQRVLGLEDELLDTTQADERDLVLVGEGALLAALGDARTGRMRDIVATIQAEQDRIIRAPLRGTLVVQGGPGTGKTAVALHRAAFLLFAHRRSLEAGGVLLVGPSPLFLRYIERVLPSLGERAVRLRSLNTLVPGYPVSEADTDAAARVKGDPRMVAVLRRTIQLSGRDRSALTPGALLQWLLQSRERLAEVGVLNPREQAALRRPTSAGWTPADLPLLDELSRQLGHRRSGRRPRAADDVNIDTLVDQMAPAGDADLRHEMRQRLQQERARALGLQDEAADRDEYAHVLVDEAQELSPMQWRSIARRCPSSSFTIVGDLAQGSGPWAPATWDEVVRRMPGARTFAMAELTVNYRTPVRPAALAARVLRGTQVDVEPPRAVRDTGEDPVIVHVDRSGLAGEVARIVAVEREVIGNGRLLVVCPAETVNEIHAEFDEATAASNPYDALDRPVAVLAAGEVHGLEFDAVVVVEPALIAGDTSRGLRALYVALTRTTRRLAIVHSAPLPPPLR